METNWTRRIVWLGMIFGSVLFWVGVLSLLTGCATVSGDRPWRIEKSERTLEGRRYTQILLCDPELCYPIWMGDKSMKERRGKAVELEIEEAR